MHVCITLQVHHDVEATVHNEEQHYCKEVLAGGAGKPAEAAYAAWFLDSEGGGTSTTQQAAADRSAA